MTHPVLIPKKAWHSLVHGQTYSGLKIVFVKHCTATFLSQLEGALQGILIIFDILHFKNKHYKFLFFQWNISYIMHKGVFQPVPEGSAPGSLRLPWFVPICPSSHLLVDKGDAYFEIKDIKCSTICHCIPLALLFQNKFLFSNFEQF